MRLMKVIVFIALTIAAVIGVVEVFCYLNIAKICTLIEQGNTQSAIQYIENTPNVNRYSAPLWMRGAINNLFERDIQLPLVVACSAGNTEVVDVLLKQGADPNRYLEENWSPMEAAIIGKSEMRLDVIKMLLANGADVNQFGSQQSALFAEVQTLMFDHEVTSVELALTRDVITLLLENDVCLVEEDGTTLLHYLSYAGHLTLLDAFYPECCQYLNAQNDRGQTPLMWAARGGEISAAVWLMDNGANKDALDLTGKTAYDYAAEKGYTEIAELLRSD